MGCLSREPNPTQSRSDFSRDAADIVTETTWHSTQKVERHKDGSVSLHFVVDGLNEIVYWLLGWSGRVTVIQPPELRAIVLDHLRKAVELNRGVISTVVR